MTFDVVGLRASAGPLTEIYDVALLDLDGVVNVGDHVVAAAPEALARAREAGMTLAFVTNNASRRPERVAERLVAFGVPAIAEEVVTSAQAGARLMLEQVGAGAAVLVCGAEALRHEISLRAMTVVEDGGSRPDGVVQGYDPELRYRDLAEAVLAIGAGATWVATNTDRTIPSPRGLLPGNGSLVALVSHATGISPLVAGKPHPALHLESMERTGARRPVIVGDRLDTDIEGATNSGCDSLLVMSGTTSAVDLLLAAPEHRPTYVSPDVAGLLEVHPEVVGRAGEATYGGWEARAARGQVVLAGRGGGGRPAADIDALRVLCAACWSVAGDPHPLGGAGQGTAGQGPALSVRATTSTAEQALRRLRLM